MRVFKVVIAITLLAGILNLAFEAGKTSGWKDGFKEGRVVGIKVACIAISMVLPVDPDIQEGFSQDCQRSIK